MQGEGSTSAAAGSRIQVRVDVAVNIQYLTFTVSFGSDLYKHVRKVTYAT